MLPSRDSQPKLRKSRSSIFDLFSKPKVERARGFRDAAPIGPVSNFQDQTPLAASKPLPVPVNLRVPSHDALPLRPPLRTDKSSKSLRSVRTRDGDTEKRHIPPFEPPPLFQAYPQSIRHTILEAPRSAHSHNAPDYDSQFGDQDLPLPTPDRLTPTQTVFSRLKSRKKTRAPAPSPQLLEVDDLDPTPSQKIYILATTGYLLQYAGRGSFDRLPEKILKLGPSSAAYASDAIEGRHWVLQVVQQAKGDDLAQGESRHFLSMVGLQGSIARKMVTSMLLIFGSPEDMDKWIHSIRKEVEAMGGKPVLEDGVKKPAQQDPSVIAAQSRRFSGIVRQPSFIQKDATSSPATSFASSPTIVVSGRPSSSNLSTLVGSSTLSSSRNSRFLAPGRQSLLFEGRYGDGVVIGPALNSPSFFEQKPSPRPSPVTLGDLPSNYIEEFPQPPSVRPSSSNASPASTIVPTASATPVVTVTSQGPTKNGQQRRSSLRSVSSVSSASAPDLDVIEQALSMQQGPAARLHARPLPLRDIQDGGDTLNRNTWRASNPITFPMPVREPLRRPSILPRNSGMEPISEAPVTAVHTSSMPTTRARPAPLSSAALIPVSAYNQRTSVTSPSDMAPARVTGMANRSAKRASVFARPIPIATPSRHPSQGSNPTSNRVSMIQSSPTSSAAPPSPVQTPPLSPSSLTPSPYRISITGTDVSFSDYFTPPTSLTPTSTTLDGLDSPLTPKINWRSSTRPTSFIRADGSGSYFPPPPSPNEDPRTSIQVPIIRPPLQRSGISRPKGLSGQLLKFPPPPAPPPTQPLPTPPTLGA